MVTFPQHSESHFTNDHGLVAGEGTGTSVRVVATRLGYEDLDTLVAIPREGGTVELPMERAAVSLPPLTVAAERRLTSRELHRLMFDREVTVGAIGITRSEIEAVPPVAEADLFRSLQSFAGVSSVNDLGGQLFVRGGDADQVAVLIDGAPVFGPFHLFGWFGMFNTDAIEYAEFYKGSFPARYGGSLSGVVSARQRTGGLDGIEASGGLSLLGLRVTADGPLPWGNARWLVAGRRASVDVARIDLPYSFYDLNLGLQAYPTEEHRLRFSLFASEDGFAWAYDADESVTLDSSWGNLVSSLSWSWVRGNRLTSDVTAYYSGYDGSLTFGGSPAAPVTQSLISAAGLRAGITVRGERTGARAGIALEGGPVSLLGSVLGAYMMGDASRSYFHGSLFAEVERWIGPFRLVPGFRAGFERRSSRAFVEPRFSARFQHQAFALSLSLDQAYQFLSVLRDANYYGPGAPMWFLHNQEQPMSVARGVSLSVDMWKADKWTGSVTGWARRFANVPHWRPVSSRDLSEMEFHDGRARGLDFDLRRHSGRIRGWLSYQWALAALSGGEGAIYHPQWDRRHEVDGTLTIDLYGGLTASLRATVGSGAPFWFPAGLYHGSFYDPYEKDRVPEGYPAFFPFSPSDQIAVWSDVQSRLPTYARYDLSARYAFQWGTRRIIPYLSVVNVANRLNVLYYKHVYSRAAISLHQGELHDTGGSRLIPANQLPRFPFIGIDFRF